MSALCIDYPQIVQDYWHAIDWDVPALWALDLPVERCPVAPLLWHLDVPVWPRGIKPCDLTPREMPAAPETHVQKAARTGNADLGFPIEIFDAGDRWMIFDGVHRLAKAYNLGHETLQMRIVPESAVTRLRMRPGQGGRPST